MSARKPEHFIFEEGELGNLEDSIRKTITRFEEWVDRRLFGHLVTAEQRYHELLANREKDPKWEVTEAAKDYEEAPIKSFADLQSLANVPGATLDLVRKPRYLFVGLLDMIPLSIVEKFPGIRNVAAYIKDRSEIINKSVIPEIQKNAPGGIRLPDFDIRDKVRTFGDAWVVLKTLGAAGRGHYGEALIGLGILATKFPSGLGYAINHGMYAREGLHLKEEKKEIRRVSVRP